MSDGESARSGLDAHGAYRDAGVDYGLLDAGKRLAVASALSTSPLLGLRGGRAIDSSRGEPAFVFEHAAQTLAIVIEGLGTKSVIARQVADQMAIDRFAEVAYDTVAAIVNDLCCVGALPLVVTAYFATGASEWYLEGARQESLLAGWRKACEDAGCTWGGGESPTLPGLLSEAEIELAGSAVGALPAGRAPILGESLKAGDQIVIVHSSGIHANGASLARAVAGRASAGYETKLPDGSTLGEALLTPSLIYVPLISALMEREIELSYISHITGHGFMKLMRPKRQLTYRISALPPVPPVLEMLVEKAGMDRRAAYSTFNMGAGYALYCPTAAVEEILAIAEETGFAALRAGVVEDGPRQVILEPAGISYRDEELSLS